MTLRFQWFSTTDTFSQFVNEVGGGVSMLPLNITILTDSPSILKEGGYILNDDQYDVYPSGYSSNQYVDPDQLKLLAPLGVLNPEWENFESLPYKNEVEIVNNIIQKKYDAVFLGINSVDGQLPILFYRIADKIMALGLDVKEYLPSCDVLVPTIHNKCFSCIFASDIAFMNRTVCENVRNSVFQYYADHFDSICEKDAFVANIFVNGTVNENHTPFNMSCQSHGNYFLRNTGTGIMNTWQDIFILISFVAVGLFVFPLL